MSSDIRASLPDLYHEYEKLVTPSEVPPELHWPAFFTLVSALIGDKACFLMGNDRIYPNIWTLLVGQSSSMRKSTAIKPVLLCAKVAANYGPPVKFIPPAGSPEGLRQAIVDADGVGFLHHPELGTLLGALRKDYMGGLTDELCLYYDPVVPDSLQRRVMSRSMSKSVDHLALTWLACTTQASLSEHLTHADSRVASGFLPRFNIVLGYTFPDPVAWPDTHTDKERACLTEKLCRRIPRTPIEYKISPEAMATYKEWYDAKRPPINKEAIDVIQSLHIRTLEVVKKYAIIMAILRADRPRIVSKDAMKVAISCGNYYFSTAKTLLEEGIPETLSDRVIQKIIKHLRKNGGQATRRELLQYTHLLVHELSMYLTSLQADGRVVYDTVTKVYKLVKNDCA